MSTVGGKEQYTQMIDWASKNLSSEEIKAFNSTIDTGTLEQAQLAIAGVQAKYSQIMQSLIYFLEIMQTAMWDTGLLVKCYRHQRPKILY